MTNKLSIGGRLKPRLRWGVLPRHFYVERHYKRRAPVDG